MNRNRLLAWGIGAVAVLVVLANTLYVVDQRHQAIVIRFGDPVRVVNAFQENDPGLKLKAPFVETAVILDKRNQGLDADQEEIIAADQERLVVDAFLRYQIVDPLRYFRALRDERTASDRLQRLINSSLRQQLGSATSEDIISKRRGELMLRARTDVARRAAASQLGIRIIDLRIKRADLPTANQAAVYGRMKTQRQQEAAQIRADGERQKLQIIAAATEESEKTRGEGDAERARLFASSFGRDPSFASFYRTMQAYEASLAQGDATLVVSPDSAFFRYFKDGAGK